jgi:hypothetical protein
MLKIKFRKVKTEIKIILDKRNINKQGNQMTIL